MIISKNSGKKRLTIGVLVDRIDSYVEIQMADGISETIAAKDCNLIIFSRTFHSLPILLGKQINKIYELAASSRLDGLIIMTESVGYLSTQNEIINIIRSFRHIPIVSLQLQLEGIPSVVCDNKAGISELMNHLIQEHGYRKIGFVRGPEDNQEALERYLAYTEAMVNNGIPVNPDTVFQGDFHASTVYHLVNNYLQKGNNEMEALVAANDEMLLGAFQALEKNGLKVPKDVALTGFDDIETMKTFVPPVTTIRQPFYEMGEKAVELLIDFIEGRDVPHLVKLPAKMVIRRSCGCSYKKIIYQKMKIVGYNEKPDDSFHSKGLWDSLFQKMVSSGHIPDENLEIHRKQLDQLLEALDQDIRDETNKDRFLSLLEDILLGMKMDQKVEKMWTSTLNQIRDAVLSIYEQTSFFNRLEIIFRKTKYLIENVINNNRVQYNYFEQKKMYRLKDVNNWISVSQSLDDTLNRLSNKLPNVDIESCYISLYQKKSCDDVLPEFSKILFAYYENGSVISVKPDIAYPTLSILPENLMPVNKKFSWITQPLAFGEQMYGFAVFGYKKDDVAFYSYLVEQISQVLYNIFIVEEKEKAKENMLAAYQLLQKSEEYFREMVSLLPFVIVETDLDMKIQFLNNTGLEAFGFEEDIRKGELSLSDFVLDEDKQKLSDYRQNIISGKKEFYHEFQLINKNGTKISLLNQAIPIYQADKIIGIRWCALDVQPLISTAISPDHAFYKKYKLRPRDKEVLTLMMKGLKNKEIAAKLFISEGAVKFHVNAIYKEFGVKNKDEFVEVIRENQINRFGYEPFFFSLIAKILKD